MATEDAIRAKYKKLHDQASEGYYLGASGWTKEEFDIIHAKIWTDMEHELIANGFWSPLPSPPPDYKALFKKATTVEAQLAVLAQALGIK